MIVVLSAWLYVCLEKSCSYRLHKYQNWFKFQPLEVDELEDSAEAESTFNLSQPEPAHPLLPDLVPVVKNFLLGLFY